MKKISSLIIALIVIFSLTGCGEKNITCTMNDDSSEAKVVATFKGNELVKEVMESTAKVGEDQIDSIYSIYQATANTFKDQAGIKVTTSKGKDSVTLKIEMQPSKMGEELLDSMDVQTDGSVEDYIDYMTEEGYTCK